MISLSTIGPSTNILDSIHIRAILSSFQLISTIYPASTSIPKNESAGSIPFTSHEWKSRVLDFFFLGLDHNLMSRNGLLAQSIKQCQFFNYQGVAMGKIFNESKEMYKKSIKTFSFRVFPQGWYLQNLKKYLNCKQHNNTKIINITINK